MRYISDEEFNIAYKCIDNIKISCKASQPYRQSLSKDELKRCKMVGLWYAMRSYKKNRNVKFSSFLYQRVRWECLRIIYDKKKYSSTNIDYIDNICVSTKNIDINMHIDIFDKLELLPNNLKDILIQKYYYNMTLTEIGDLNGYSYETARRKIFKALKSLKKSLKSV